MNLVNLTPHAITLRSPEGVDTVIFPSGQVARVSSTPGQPETLDGIPVPVYSPQKWGEIEGLPTSFGCKPGDTNTMYIVSALVLAEVAKRLGPNNHNCCAPGTGPNDEAIRNDKGHIVAVTRLVRG